MLIKFKIACIRRSNQVKSNQRKVKKTRPKKSCGLNIDRRANCETLQTLKK